MKKKTKCYIYTRVSTSMQVEGYSLDAQRDKLRMEKLLNLDGLLLQVTAPGKTTDSVSRSFAPKLRVTEDPVCGSGHCHIVPYWSEKLGKKEIVAYNHDTGTMGRICQHHVYRF